MDFASSPPPEDPQALIKALELKIALKRAQRLHQDGQSKHLTFILLFIIGLGIGVAATWWYLSAVNRPASNPKPAPSAQAAHQG